MARSTWKERTRSWRRFTWNIRVRVLLPLHVEDRVLAPFHVERVRLLLPFHVEQTGLGVPAPFHVEQRGAG